MSTKLKSQPSVIDELGVEHRHGCHLPGWVSDRPAVRGWFVIRCAACGVCRLVRAGAGAR